MSTSDKEYIETRDINRGKRQVEEPFKSLIDWFSNFYGTRPLNICYEFLNHNQRPRLEIIFEKMDLNCRFYEYKEKDIIIEKVFKELIVDYPQYKSYNLFVISSCFDSIAKMEANYKIDKKKIEKLKNELNIPELWHIERTFGYSAIFFFHTQEQEDRLSHLDDLKMRFVDKYFELIKKYDEFGYLKREEFGIRFDNKERFQNIYQGNWRYYFMDN
jgi:hypothetical protein